MNCKNCGGTVVLENGTSVCQNCGAVFAPEIVYENIDVFICYVENDTSGRRTKDSIIAQDVYRKLEEKKITTFYERISADGLVGDQLELCRYGALWAAKTVLVLGASVESFKLLEERYGAFIENKPMIPFCADVNPSVIPEAFSKLQAINSSTIGWEMDLISGLCNILGRPQEVDTNSLFSATQKKIWIIVGAVAALLTIGLAVFMFLRNPMKLGNSVETTEESAWTAPTETQPPTPQEIFDKASALVEQGSYYDALSLLLQIPEHNGTASLLKQIYGKYEGYYQNDHATIHLDVIENTQVKLSVIVRTGETTISTAVNTDVVDGKLSYNYVDNYKNTGKLEMQIVNAGLQLTVMPDDGEAINISYTLEEKSDQPMVQLDKATILEWINKKYTLAQIKGVFFDVQTVEDISGAAMLYIPDVNIYIAMSHTDFNKAVVCGVSAPAEWVAPELVGKDATPHYAKDVLYIPNAYLVCATIHPPHTFNYFAKVDKKVTNDTLVAVFTKKSMGASWNGYLYDAAYLKVIHLAVKKFALKDNAFTRWRGTNTKYPLLGNNENKTHYLIAIADEDQFIWYKVKKSDLSAEFMRTGPVLYGSNVENESLWFTEYIDLAEEFPDMFLSISSGEFGPVSFKIKQGCTVYSDSSYESEVLRELGPCIVSLGASLIDENGKYWYKLWNQNGWICVTDILQSK